MRSGERDATKALIEDLRGLAGTRKTIKVSELEELLDRHELESYSERFSVCPNDGEPLVSSFEVRQCEWVCEVCGSYFSMFGVPTRKRSLALIRRYEELLEASHRRRLAASKVAT